MGVGCEPPTFQRHGGGFDLEVIQQHYNWFVKMGWSHHAGALKAIATGALWPGSRKLDAGLINEDQNICPLCHRKGHDERHVLWECSVACSNEHPHIQRTNYLAPTAKAALDQGSEVCL